MRHIAEIMQLSPVIPVLVIDEVGQAVPLAEALVAGGLRVLEVTLRTPAALDAIREMKQIPGAVVGAGTVLNPEQLDQALAAGSEFIVSPGLTEPLGRAAVENGVPFLPGVATSGEIMRGLDLGLTHFKFFPAMAAGGIPALKAIGGPFADVRFGALVDTNDLEIQHVADLAAPEAQLLRRCLEHVRERTRTDILRHRFFSPWPLPRIFFHASSTRQSGPTWGG
jgi:2-dehydro-3-deoxyphosphogluconate aldolase/(4S)-4-hydroxy-2-oxoglutarate aldolase